MTWEWINDDNFHFWVNCLFKFVCFCCCNMQKYWAILVSFYYICKFYKIGMWQKGQYSLLRVDRLKTRCTLLCWTHYQSMQDNNSKPHLILNQPRNNILFSPVLTAPSFWVTGRLSKQTGWFPDLRSYSYSQWIFCKLYSHISPRCWFPTALPKIIFPRLSEISLWTERWSFSVSRGVCRRMKAFAIQIHTSDTRVVDCLQDSISMNTKHLLPRRKRNIS